MDILWGCTPTTQWVPNVLDCSGSPWTLLSCLNVAVNKYISQPCVFIKYIDLSVMKIGFHRDSVLYHSVYRWRCISRPNRDNFWSTVIEQDLLPRTIDILSENVYIPHTDHLVNQLSLTDHVRLLRGSHFRSRWVIQGDRQIRCFNVHMIAC